MSDYALNYIYVLSVFRVILLCLKFTRTINHHFFNFLFELPSLKTSLISFRSHRLQMFFKIGVLKNFAIPTGKHLCWSLFLTTFRPECLQLNQKEIPTQLFSCNHCKFLCGVYLVAASVPFIYYLVSVLIKKMYCEIKKTYKHID